jgi:hypothetical protein
MLNLFPPLLMGGVHVVEVGRDFRSCRVRVAKSLLTRNLQGSTFGGTIFAAADPFHAILYWQALAHRGIRVQAWLKRATIAYRKPASTALTLEFALGDDDIESAVRAIEAEGRFERSFRVDAVDAHGVACAEVETLVHLRRPRDDQREASGF